MNEHELVMKSDGDLGQSISFVLQPEYSVIDELFNARWNMLPSNTNICVMKAEFSRPFPRLIKHLAMQKLNASDAQEAGLHGPIPLGPEHGLFDVEILELV